MTAAGAAAPVNIESGRWRTITLVGRGVLLETMRRKDFYVLLILTALLALAVLAVNIVGIQDDSTATLLTNLGMTFAYFSAHVLTLLTAARQVPGEIETRQIHPLLAKPVSRDDYILGKWAATWTAGTIALFFLFAIGYLPIPRLQSFSGALLAQTLALHVVSIALMAALGICFSLFMPKGVNLVVIALIWLASDKILEFVRARAIGSAGETITRWITAYIPDFEKLNMITRYTDGVGALGAGEFAGLVVYGAVVTAAALAIACWAFRRRPL